MAKILLHCPLNISRTLVKMMEEFGQQFKQKHGIDLQIETQPHRPDEKSLFQSYLEKGDMPDLIVGHADDFADLPQGFLSENFQSLPGRYPVRKELSDAGFADEKGFFHPFVVIPFAIFYNHNLIEKGQIPGSWKDLLDNRWHGKILMPDSFRIVSVVIKASIKADFPDDPDIFEKNTICQGSPMEVVTAVDEGDYPIGITNIAFARISRHKNTSIIWPGDGLFCMPQVMVWSNKATGPLFEIGDFLMSSPVQEYFSMQSFVPALPDVEMHPLVVKNNCRLRWNGWDSFLEALKARKV